LRHGRGRGSNYGRRGGLAFSRRAGFGRGLNLGAACGEQERSQGTRKASQMHPVTFAEHSGLLQDRTMVAKTTNTVKRNMLKDHINLCEIACYFQFRTHSPATLENAGRRWLRQED